MAGYWHFEVSDWKDYERIRTIDPGKPGGMKIRIGISKEKGPEGGRTHTVEFLFSKEEWPSESEAEAELDKITGKEKKEESTGNQARINNMARWNWLARR